MVKNGASKPVLSKATGQDYILTYFNGENPWDIGELDVEKINKYRADIYAVMIANNILGLIFQGPYICNILDPKGNSREDIAEWFRGMLTDIDFEDKLYKSANARLVWPAFIFSDTIEEKEGKIQVTEIRDLPPETFGTAGSYNTDAVFGKILKGIVRESDGTIHYWQDQQTGTVEIAPCHHFRSHVYSYNIDGVPVLTPVYKLIKKLGFAWDGLMQANNRANVLFMRINKVQPLPTAGRETSNWALSNQILKDYNRNTFFTLGPDMEPIELKGPVSDIALDTIGELTKLVLSIIFSKDFTAKDGTLIGGSTAGETGLFKNAIIGLQKQMLKPWIPYFNRILEWNGFTGFTLELKLPEPEFKNEELDFQKGLEILKAYTEKGAVIGSMNEVRTFWGLEDADTDFLTKAGQEWSEATIKQESEPIEEEVPEKEEVQEDDEIKEDIKKNQGIQTREEIEEELRGELEGHWKAFFEAVSQ